MRNWKLKLFASNRSASSIPLSDEIKAEDFITKPQEIKTDLFKTVLPLAEALIRSVIASDIELAEKIIKSNPKLLLIPAKIKDFSMREFKEVTPFQYAWLVQDADICEMMLKYLKEEAITQLTTLSEKQITWQPLIDILSEYTQKSFKEWEWNDPRGSKFWREIVGGEQMKLPAHVVKTCFLQKTSQPSKGIVINQSGTLAITSLQEWFNPSKLGHEWAIFKGGNVQAIACGSLQSITEKGEWVTDQIALTELLKQCSQKMTALKEQISKKSLTFS